MHNVASVGIFLLLKVVFTKFRLMAESALYAIIESNGGRGGGGVKM